MTELIDYLDQHGIKHKSIKNGILMQCCFHDDNNPSLKVGRKYYRCYGCGESGLTHELYTRFGIEVTSHHKARNVVVSAPVKRRITVYDGIEGGYKWDIRAGKYLKSRGITYQTSKMFDVRYNASAHTVVIPIRTSSGQTVSLFERGITSKDKLKEPQTDSKSVLFGLDVVLRDKLPTAPLLITEGEIDAMSVCQAGHGCVSSMGLLMTNEQMQLLSRFRSALYITDSDVKERGDFYIVSKNLKDTARRMSVSLQVVAMTEHKDMNELLQQCGIRGLKVYIKKLLRSQGYVS